MLLQTLKHNYFMTVSGILSHKAPNITKDASICAYMVVGQLGQRDTTERGYLLFINADFSVGQEVRETKSINVDYCH